MGTEQNRSSEATSESLLNRREALTLVGTAATATALAGCGSGSMGTGACVGAGTGMPLPGAEQLQAGQAKLLPEPATSALFIIARDEQGFFAMKNYCTHSGCGLEIQPDKTYLCACHNSIFSADGINLSGPATRPLDHVAMCRRSDGVLVVDKTKTLPGQDARVK